MVVTNSKNPVMDQEFGLPLVSVIIPTKNSEKTLEKCLQSLINQTFKNMEIIVVDNYSSDRTIEIARQFNAKIFSQGPERSSQVNYAVKMSNGKYVYRVDSDFVLEPLVIMEAVRKAENEHLDAVIIHNTSDPTISFWAKVRKFERDFYNNDEMNVAARFIKKDIFLLLNGFDKYLVAGEDYDLHNRLLSKGFKIGRIENKETHIGEPQTLIQIAKKHYYYGRTIRRFIRKNSKRGLLQLSPFRRSHLVNWQEFLKHPVLFVGFTIYQFVRYSFAIFGYIVSLTTKESSTDS